ncbi:MAG: hypothetical protein RR478_03095 [Bacilli bacterium]
MEKEKNIKKTIKLIREKQKEQNISLLEYLNNNDMDILDLLLSIGVSENLLFGFFSSEIIELADSLLQDKDLIIDYNESMQDLDLDEISLYSKVLGSSFTFNTSSIRFINEKAMMEGTKEITECANRLYRIEGKKLKKLEFYDKMIIDINLSKEKVLSQKFPLDYAYILAHDEIVDEDDQKLRQNSFEVISTGGINADEFYKLINRLYSFSFASVYMIFLNLVSDKTLLRDDFSLKNMNNSITR